jgi:ATP-binding cassette, subfamily B, bacterial
MARSRYGDLELYARLARQARSSWPEITGLFLVGLLATPLALLAPLPLKIAVDSVLNSQPVPAFLDAVLPRRLTSTPTALLVIVAALTVLIACLTQLQGFAQRYLSAAAGEKLVMQFRALIFRHIQRLSLSYHDAMGSADSLYRVQNDAPAIRYIIVDGFVPSVSSVLTFVGMLYVAMRLDWQLALVGLAISPALLVATHVYRPRLRNQSREVRKLESSAMTVVHEVLGALRVVKAFGQEEREGDRFADRSALGVRGRIDLAKTEGHFNIIVGLVTALGAAAVLFIGVRHVRAGTLSLGDFLLVSGYIAKLYEPVKTISRKLATLQGHLANLERVLSLLDDVPDVTERPDAIPISRASGAVTFRHVSFSYAKDRPVLHDISFDIVPGARVGIAGTTGAGKSTLVSLLMRLYDPADGEILLDGVNVRDYRLSDLRRQFAIVLQDTVLFSGTIAENIAYAVPRASHGEIMAAARAADAHAFIERLPQGYETQVGERGVQLSGGQRQRIALARAFLKDSPVLILDEPTSAVDAQTEAAIVEALERLQQGRTVIIVSHRPSAVARCSAFLTIEHGRLVADTDHPPESAPITSPRRVTAARRRETLLAHPAVQAWRRLGADRMVPDRICGAKVKPKRARPMKVFRLEGVGAEGATVIAKWCKRADGLIEHTVYEQILPHVPLPGPRYYGAIPEASDDPEKDGCWLFIGEIHGEKYDELLPEHRAAAARWLGTLHTHARDAARLAKLPDAGPGRYRRHMHTARDLIRNHLDNPSFSADDLQFLDLLLGRFDQLEEQWDWLENAVAGIPHTFAHGDFNGKNLRLLKSAAGSEPQIVAFDWEDSGWGVPAADLAQVFDTSCRMSAMPDLATYLSLIREHWPECRRSDVERLGNCGAVFRALATIQWDAVHFAYDWADLFVPNLRQCETELAHALDRLGWAERSASVAVADVQGGPALEERVG